MATLEAEHTSVHSEKLAQAVKLVADSDADAWITFVRETSGGGDPVVPLLIDGALTWLSALIVTGKGERVAVVGNYDADPLRASGDWTEIVPYVQGIREALIATLDKLVPGDHPKLAVNFSTSDVKADGLGHGMFILLERYLSGTKFEGSLVSAEEIVMPLRGQKTEAEIRAMREAIAETDRLFMEIGQFAQVGKSELEIFGFVHDKVDGRRLGYAWAQEGDPIVNTGPDSMIGHGIPSGSILIEPGHIFHVDLGVIKNSYSSDIQRCWYVPAPGETDLPEDVVKAFAAVNLAIDAGANALKPGVKGHEVDRAARDSLVSGGYPEYLHAFGHQVGRVAHDGGAILGPRWERYGKTPDIPIRVDEAYTLELGVELSGRGYLGLEEMAVVREGGVEWLTDRQTQLWLLGGS